MAQFDATYLEQFKADLFVETGTFKGNGIQRALDAGMGEVHSIEIDARCFERLPEKLRQHPHVHLHLGDSAEILDHVLRSLELPGSTLTVFLDAHVMTGQLTAAKNPCPVLRELDILGTHTDQATILVDDMRIFATARDSWKKVTIDDIRAKVHEINPSYRMRFEKDLLIATA